LVSKPGRLDPIWQLAVVGVDQNGASDLGEFLAERLVTMQHRFLAAALALCIGSVSACGSSTRSSVELDLPATTFGEPSGYGSVAWFDENVLAVQVSEGVFARSDLAILGMDGGSRDVIPVEPRPECVDTSFGAPTTIAPRRLGAVDYCAWPDRPPTADFVEVDLTSGTSISLATLDEAPRTLTWSPELGEGIFSYGSRICEGLRRIRDGRDEPLDLLVTVSGKQFNLGDDIWEHCETTGRADYPAYAPDGERFAFLASPGPGGAADPDAGPPWAIVVVGSDGSPQAVLDGIRDPGGLAWAADGSTVIFAGEYGDRTGLWAAAIDGSQMWHLSPERPDSIALSPDRQRLAGVVWDTFATVSPRSHIIIVELPDFAKLRMA
jgi:hypothetical protein